MITQLNFSKLDVRRRKLGMSCAIVARMSGVSLPTVQRTLSGRHQAASFANVEAIAQVLGVELRFVPVITTKEYRKQKAEEKALWLTGLVQGTSGLEGQALGRETLLKIKDMTMRKLLAGSKRKLWED